MFLNLAAYQFVTLAPTPALRDRLREEGRVLGLRGTVLLAPEGINLFVCGQAQGAETFLQSVQGIDGVRALDVKRSWSAQPSFERWLVKIKREIITLGQPQIRPQDGRAPVVDATTLAHWLDQRSDDEGRPIVLVDTRNHFEVQAGTFEDAIDLQMASFTDLPAALARHRDALGSDEAGSKRVVTFCTGGIRCEKAALALEQAGIPNVVQLDGGVLRYFETVGRRHWQGELFIFDKRNTLTPERLGG